jgi:dolichyl-phosphate beta-glucosyltransferase
VAISSSNSIPLNAWQEQIETWVKASRQRDSERLSHHSLSIVVPAFNEERRLLTPLLDALTFCEQYYEVFEVIVVDDGSTDNTSKLVTCLSKVHNAVKLITLEKNQGKGAALRAGVLSASHSMVLMMDADGATPIKELDRLVAYYDQGYEVIIGSRATMDASVVVSAKVGRKFLGKAFNLIVNTLLIPEVADSQCGFKLFSQRAARFLFGRMRCNGFGFDTELLYMARRCNILVKEVAVNWQHIEGSKVNVLSDSLKMFRDLLKHRYNHRTLDSAAYLPSVQKQTISRD